MTNLNFILCARIVLFMAVLLGVLNTYIEKWKWKGIVTYIIKDHHRSSSDTSKYKSIDKNKKNLPKNPNQGN